MVEYKHNMKKAINSTLRRLSGLVQSSTGSFKRHNNQYLEEGKLEREREAGLKNIEKDLINGPEMLVRDLLSNHSEVRTAVDVGSGTGWSAAALSPLVETVIAIEPSKAAVDISKKIYTLDQYPNITWINGFAESTLPTLKLDTPTLFLTGCVLSHIRDKEVEKICTKITKSAPIGSVLSFAECWGEKEWHQLMWHVRTKTWWQNNLPGWELDFHGPEVPEKDTYKGRYNKGIWGVKKN